ncbi:hypothetical protein ACLMJK_007706 [Lecanora helva]
MLVLPISSLCLLLTYYQFLAVQARALSLSAVAPPSINNSFAGLSTLPNIKFLGKRNEALIIHGLPQSWQGAFTEIRSLQPPLPIGAFAYFFSQVAHTVRGDSVQARPYRKFTCGSLAIEFIAAAPEHRAITKEFVEAAAWWLFDAAEHGWASFFKAWVQDQDDREVIYITLANVWDRLIIM